MSSSSWSAGAGAGAGAGGGGARVVRFAASSSAAVSALPMVLPEQQGSSSSSVRRRRRVRWVTRVQGRRELSAACTAARREGATMFVRLTRTGCRPCAASEAVVRAALAAVEGNDEEEEEEEEEDEEEDPTDRSPQLRVFWLNADDPGSSDAMAFFTSRRLCRGVPAHFLWRGSQDLHMPDLALDGAEPVALARLLARAGADGGPPDLGEPGAMEAKNAGADLARLRREGDHGSLAVLAAIESAAAVVPTPPLPSSTTTPLPSSTTTPYHHHHPYLQQPYLPYPQQYNVPPPIQRHFQQQQQQQQQQRPGAGAMHFTW